MLPELVWAVALKGSAMAAASAARNGIVFMLDPVVVF